MLSGVVASALGWAASAFISGSASALLPPRALPSPALSAPLSSNVSLWATRWAIPCDPDVGSGLDGASRVKLDLATWQSWAATFLEPYRITPSGLGCGWTGGAGGALGGAWRKLKAAESRLAHFRRDLAWAAGSGSLLSTQAQAAHFAVTRSWHRSRLCLGPVDDPAQVEDGRRALLAWISAAAGEVEAAAEETTVAAGLVARAEAECETSLTALIGSGRPVNRNKRTCFIVWHYIHEN